MKYILSQQALALALTLTLCVTQAAFPKTITRNQKSIVTTLADNTQRYAIGQERQGMYLGASSAKRLGCTSHETPDPIRGFSMSCTFHDLQKFGSMGRQIATVGPHYNINSTWTNQDNDNAFGGRNVRYHAYDPIEGALCDVCGSVDIGPSLIPPDRSGFPVLATTSNETVIVAYHWDKNFGAPGSKFSTYISQNQTPTLGDFVTGKVDSAALAFEPDMLLDGLIWPQIAVTEIDQTPIIIHLLLSGQARGSDGVPFGPNLVVYIRRVGTVWQSVDTFFLAESYFRSPVITASRQSQRVAMAFSGGRGDGSEFGGPLLRNNSLPSGKNDNDLYLRISEDAGVTWGPLTNITRRVNSDPGGFAPHAKLSILFDEADVLHVVWQAISWPGYEGEFNTRSRLFHWDEGSAAVRTAFDAVWDPIWCNGGENTLNIDNPQLSACDGKLYLTFVQYAPVPYGRGDDCATRAFSGKETGSANGDIYVTVSSNGGFNWDPSRNLTNTYTPNCDTVPGGDNPDCDSDVWHSVIRYGIDVTDGDWEAIPDLTVNIDGAYAGSDYLFVQYINDGDAGAAVRGEGAWTNNAVKAIRFGCVDVVPAACLNSTLPSGQIVDDPAHTPPGTDSTIFWQLSNNGNMDIDYTFEVVTLTGPEGHTTVNGETSGGGTIGSGAINFVDFTVRLNANLSTVVENASSMIILEGNFGPCFNSPDTLFINYCICDLQNLKIDSLDNFMVLANNGNIGLRNNKTLGKLNFDFVGDPAECDTNATSYLFDGSPVISYNNGHVVTAMYSLSIVDSFQFRPQGEPQAETEFLYEHVSSGLFTTQDSALGLSVDYWTPHGNLPVAGTWKPVIVRVGYFNLTAAPLDSVFCAYALDWDVPSDSGVRNSSAIQTGATPTYVYQQGAEFGMDTGNSACRDNNTRYAATIYTPPQEMNLSPYTDTGSGAMGVGFQSLYTRDNATFVGNDWDHRALDSMLRNNFGQWAFSSPDPDSQFIDLHTVFNGGAYRIDPNDTLYLWLRLLTGFGTQAEFEAAASATIALAHPEGCCQTPGDANGSGSLNIADITFLIARIFAGGSASPCCQEADCNGDGKVNIADVTCFICRIFSPAEFCSAPVCGPVGMTCGN